ncbi:MAG: hypothetical protein HYT15_02215 [Candidatus Magasanikbacteria bacterium]|nr:hypothetical protein [Candidatus Magasanikbacteria bacterium]
MLILRKYQLDIIFLFVALLIFIMLFFYFIAYFGQDPHKFQWYVAGPLLILYAVYIWEIRNKINISERRCLTNKTLTLWILLGIGLFAIFDQPIPAKEYLSLNVLFILFTLFLADSYWDFKKISMKSFIDRKEK